jgi:aspartyl-tRNA synthetase
VVVNQENAADAHAKAKEVRGEYVLVAIGEVVLRDEGARNPKLATGEVEVQATQIIILNDARPLLFNLMRLIQFWPVKICVWKYRYLDLRPSPVAVQPAPSSSNDSGNQSIHGRAGLHANRNPN